METAPKEAVHADLGDEIKTAFEKFGDCDSKVPKEELARTVRRAGWNYHSRGMKRRGIIAPTYVLQCEINETIQMESAEQSLPEMVGSCCLVPVDFLVRTQGKSCQVSGDCRLVTSLDRTVQFCSMGNCINEVF